jgi:serine/threonine protein kinase
MIDILNLNNNVATLCVPLSECRYKFIRRIGSGACGTVYEALQTYRVISKSSVAVKMLHFTLASKDAVEDLRHVKSELELNVQLSRSSLSLVLAPCQSCAIIPWVIVGPSGNIVRYHFVVFLEMELADESLADWLKKRNARIDQDNGIMKQEDYLLAVKLAKDVTIGLQLLHERLEPVIHGDLHLGNVLIHHYQPYPVAKLADFSNSKFMSRLPRRPNATPFVPVRSPSSQSGRPSIKEDDIYALGRILLYLLVPYSNDVVEELCENIVSGNVGKADVFDENCQPLSDLASKLLRNEIEPHLALTEVQACINEYFKSQSLAIIEPAFDGFDSPPLADMLAVDKLVERISKHSSELVSIFCSLQQYIQSNIPNFDGLLSADEWKTALEYYFPYCMSVVSEMRKSYNHFVTLQATSCSEIDSVFNTVMSDFALLEYYSY